MATRNAACYYGRHIGCLNMDDPGCRLCAERLTNAVNQKINQTASNAAGACPPARLSPYHERIGTRVPTHG